MEPASWPPQSGPGRHPPQVGHQGGVVDPVEGGRAVRAVLISVVGGGLLAGGQGKHIALAPPDLPPLCLGGAAAPAPPGPYRWAQASGAGMGDPG